MDTPDTAGARRATVYRMVMGHHVCPYGLKVRHLLRREGFEVDDHWLTTLEEVDAFKLRFADREPDDDRDGRVDGPGGLRTAAGLGAHDVITGVGTPPRGPRHHGLDACAGVSAPQP